MLDAKDRDPSDERAVLDAILASREVYPDEEFQIWANAWLSGRDREQVAAETTEKSIRIAWLLPQPFGDEWKLRVIEMIFSGVTGEELYDKALKPSEVDADSGEIPTSVDLEAEVTMLAVCSALSATQAAYAYASEALDAASPESSRERVREVLAVSSTYAKRSLRTVSGCGRSRQTSCCVDQRDRRRKTTMRTKSPGRNTSAGRRGAGRGSRD